MIDTSNKKLVAYLIGVSLGDGNLSNPNKRAVRLRISCDQKYPGLINKIEKSLLEVAKRNKVSRIRRRDGCTDLSCYSNDWESILGWKALNGSKFKQKASVPIWVKKNKNYSIQCLTGLIETDGSVYKDRNYLMINFTTIIPNLAKDVATLLKNLGFKPNMQKSRQKTGKLKYVIRVSKDTSRLISLLNISSDKLEKIYSK